MCATLAHFCWLYQCLSDYILISLHAFNSRHISSFQVIQYLREVTVRNKVFSLSVSELAKPVNIAVTAALDIFYVEWKSSLPDNNNDDVTYNVTWKHEEDSDDHECSVRDLKANCSLEKDGRGEMHTVSVTTIADGRKMEDCGGQCQVEHFASKSL